MRQRIVCVHLSPRPDGFMRGRALPWCGREDRKTQHPHARPFCRERPHVQTKFERESRRI